MGRDRNRPHARPATAMGDAKGLVQVEVTNVGAIVAGPAQPHLRVHVRAREQQELYRIDISPQGSDVKGGLPDHVRRVDIFTFLKKSLEG